MVDIRISEEIKRLSPSARLGSIHSDICYQKENALLWHRIDQLISPIENTLNQNEISELPVIQHTRQAYLAIGKEPVRYFLILEEKMKHIRPLAGER